MDVSRVASGLGLVHLPHMAELPRLTEGVKVAELRPEDAQELAGLGVVGRGLQVHKVDPGQGRGGDKVERLERLI